MLCKHVKTLSPEELRTIFSLNSSDNDPVTLSLSEVCVIILIFKWNNCNCNKWVAVCAWMCVSSSVTFGIAVKTCYFFRESRESCQTPLEKPSDLKLVAFAGTVWTLWNTICTYSYLLGPPCSFSICYTWRYYIHCGKKQVERPGSQVVPQDAICQVWIDGHEDVHVWSDHLIRG